MYVAVPEATGGELCLRNADRPPWRSERGVIDREVVFCVEINQVVPSRRWRGASEI